MAQAFERQATRTPVAIADISIQLMYPEPGSGQPPEATYSVQVRYDSDEVRVLDGDLVPHLTQAEITALLDFMASLRQRAETQILPE